MVEEYRKAAEAAGHKVTLVDVAHEKIAGCLACEYCHGKGNGACIQKDDMQVIYPLLVEAEVLVLATPIYYFTMSAQIQAPIQRIRGYHPWLIAETGQRPPFLRGQSRLFAPPEPRQR